MPDTRSELHDLFRTCVYVLHTVFEALVTCKGCGCHRFTTVLVIVISKVQLLGANLHSTCQLLITAKCLCQFDSS